MSRNKSARAQAKQIKAENRISDEQQVLLNLIVGAGIQKEELEKIINTRKEGFELNIDVFKKLKQEEWENYDFQAWVSERKQKYEESLENQYLELVENNNKLSSELDAKKVEKNSIEQNINDLNKQKTKAEEDKARIIKETENFKNQLRSEVEKDLNKKKEELEDREKLIQKAEETLNKDKTEFEEFKSQSEDAFVIQREEIARDRRGVDRDRKLLEQLRAIYDESSPGRLKFLEAELQEKSAILESKAAELARVMSERDSLKLEKLRTEGKSEDDLRSENVFLKEKLEQFENKYSSYTDARLREMESAYNAKNEKDEQIANLHSQLISTKNLLAKLQNNQLTTEQELAQLDLVRTLNKALRKELDNTRRMIEGSSGDICVSLTDIDNEVANKHSVRYAELSNITERPRQNDMSLSKIIDHVYKYAASRPKPLYYSREDLSAFLAGLSVSRLSILQGMSGTGKTSLPRVFMEALSGLISVVPVESSWRDRNELLGYYNDFSKRFSAKEFTCSLYRAGLKAYSEIPYFIVLDEMNLSRVEYYFADFLSVLEADPEDWQISLVDIDMRQLPTVINERMKQALAEDAKKQKDEVRGVIEKFIKALDKKDKVNSNSAGDMSLSVGEKSKLVAYLASFEEKCKKEGEFESLLQGPSNLIDGKKIIVPKNVWFVGTANRDESTFEITDKVYDRAQVLNFNQRAKKENVSGSSAPIRITVQQLEKLFEQARQNSRFRVEDEAILVELERELNKHGVAYGNRIADHIEKFVPVYVAACGGSNLGSENLKIQAIDYQITNKVLRKLDVNDLSKDSIESLTNLLEKCKLEKAWTYITNQIDK